MLILPHRASGPPAGLLARDWVRYACHAHTLELPDRRLYIPDHRIRLPGRDVRPGLRRAITVTSIGTAHSSGSSSVTVSLSSLTVAVGNLVLVAVEDAGSGGTVSDTKSNTYTLLTSANPNNNSSNGTTQLFWSVLTTQLSSGASDSIKYTTSSGTHSMAASAFFANSSTGWLASPVDTAVTATHTGGASPASGSGGTPAASGELWVGVVGVDAFSGTGTITNSGSWSTPPVTDNTEGPATIGGGTQVGTASAPSYSATLSATGPQWALLLAAFKPAADVLMAQILM